MTDAADHAEKQPSEGRAIALVLAIIMGWIASGVAFGYPGVIVPALILVAVAFAGIVTLSRG